MLQLIEAKVPLKPKKHVFFVEATDCLIYIIRSGRLDQEKRTAYVMQKWEKPKTQNELRFFSGFFIVFECFIPNSMCFPVPLNNTLRNDHPKAFGPRRK